MGRCLLFGRRRDAFEEGVDAGARRLQAGLERVALGLQGLHLFEQQVVGALQLLVAQQQALHALGDLVQVHVIGHGVAGG